MRNEVSVSFHFPVLHEKIRFICWSFLTFWLEKDLCDVTLTTPPQARFTHTFCEWIWTYYFGVICMYPMWYIYIYIYMPPSFTYILVYKLWSLCLYSHVTLAHIIQIVFICMCDHIIVHIYTYIRVHMHAEHIYIHRDCMTCTCACPEEKELSVI
jgi:hypothetical protein